MSPNPSNWRNARSRRSASETSATRFLDSRWGDQSITAPSDGGWNHTDISRAHQLTDQPDHNQFSKLLSNKLSRRNTPEMTTDEDISQGGSDRRTINISIPVPWSKKLGPRSRSLPRSPAPEAWYVDGEPRVNDPLPPPQSLSANTSRITSPSDSTVPPIDVRISSVDGRYPPVDIHISPAEVRRSSPFTSPVERRAAANKYVFTSANGKILSPVREDFNRVSPMAQAFQQSQVEAPPKPASVATQGMTIWERRNLPRLNTQDLEPQSPATDIVVIRPGTSGMGSRSSSRARSGATSATTPTNLATRRAQSSSRVENTRFVTAYHNVGPNEFEIVSRSSSAVSQPLETSTIRRRRAASEEPVVRRALASNPITPIAITPTVSYIPLHRDSRARFSSGSESTVSDTSMDSEATREDLYVASRKHRYGSAGAGPSGFYKGVVRDYQQIGKFVVEDSGCEISAPLADHGLSQKLEEKLRIVESTPPLGSTVLVPSHEELWGS